MDWRFSTFLLLLFALLIGFSFAPSEQVLCSGKFIEDALALHNKDGAANCFDFWLNRYQTLIGAAAALIAATVAWLGVKQQIGKMNGQIEIARKQNAIALLPILESRAAIISAIYSISRSFDVFFVGLKIKANMALQTVGQIRSAREVEGGVPGDQTLSRQLEEYKDLFGKTERELRRFNKILRRRSLAGDVEHTCQSILGDVSPVLASHRHMIADIENYLATNKTAAAEIDNALRSIQPFNDLVFSLPKEVYEMKLRKLSRCVQQAFHERDKCIDEGRP